MLNELFKYCFYIVHWNTIEKEKENILNMVSESGVYERWVRSLSVCIVLFLPDECTLMEQYEIK